MKNISLVFVFIFGIINGSKADNLFLQNLILVNDQWKNQEFNPSDFSSFENSKPQNFNQWISVHLLLVEKNLRSRDVSKLNPEQYKNRIYLLDQLKEYALNGIFPVNNFILLKNPVFIDARGTHCAVGYLMQQSGAEQLAQQINKNEKFAYIHQIKTKGVGEWAKNNGFSLDELAWIQPGYPPNFTANPLLQGLNGSVKTMAINPSDGTIYVGGSFSAAVDGTVCSGIAAYINGFAGYSWIDLAGGVNGTVNKILLHQNKLIVGGSFTTAGSLSVLNVAAYNLNNGTWEQMGNLNGNVKTFEVFNGQIYAGGSFNSFIAKWNGTSWEEVLPGYLYGNEVRALKAHENELIIGGDFELPTGALRKNAFAFDGTQAVIMGFGTKTPVNDFEIYQGKIYAGCDYISGNDTCALASFMDGDWQTIFDGNFYYFGFGSYLHGTIKQMKTFEASMYIAGDFSANSGMTFGENMIRYSETANDTVPMPILMADSTINCFGFYYNDICYGGDFTYQPGSNLNRIALLQNELLVSAKTKTVKDKINFFPNPSTDKIYITNNLDEPIESVKLFSADGKLILSQVNLGKQAVIQLEKPANGIYFIESINRTNSSFNKVIFE
jgi:hypothetical protein